MFIGLGATESGDSGRGGVLMPCGDYRVSWWRIQGLAGVARVVSEGSGRGLPIVARSVSWGGYRPLSPPHPLRQAPLSITDKPPCLAGQPPLSRRLRILNIPPPPVACLRGVAPGAGTPNPAMNTPSDKATPLLTRVSPQSVNAALLSCAYYGVQRSP
jgi:hypothetical protein